MAPKVSVIIPIYNAMPYLTQMMDSVCAQTLKDIEIICVDDGSTDNSCKVIEEYCAKDNRVRLIRQEHSNAGAARNNGLQFASGEYLAFLDADDFFSTEMLLTAYEKAQEDRSDIVVFRSDLYSNRSGDYKPMPGTICSDLLPSNQPFSPLEIEKNFFNVFVWWPWDKLYRADLIRQNNLRYQSLRTTNDLLFVCSAILKANRISVIDTILAHHRVLDSGESLSVSREKSWDNFYFALRGLLQQIKEWNLYDRLEQDFVNYCLHFSLWHLSTLKGLAYHKLYSKLVTEWFDEFGVSGRDSTYFYEEYEYEQYMKIVTMSSEEYLFARIEQSALEQDAVKNNLLNLNSELAKTKAQLNESQSIIVDTYNKLNNFQRLLEESNRKITVLQSTLAAETQRRLDIEKSVSYQVGRAITWLGRVMRNQIRMITKKEVK